LQTASDAAAFAHRFLAQSDDLLLLWSYANQCLPARTGGIAGSINSAALNSNQSRESKDREEHRNAKKSEGNI
jgi:hypothetical protein